MAYRKTLYGEATTRLRTSQKSGTNKHQRELLGQQLQTFFIATGLQPRGAQGLLPPNGMTSDQKDVFDSIISAFMENSKSAKDINKEFNKMTPEQQKIKVKVGKDTIERKARTTAEKQKAVNKKIRIETDAKLHKNIYSNILKEVWDLTDENGWDTDAVYKALSDTLDELDKGRIPDTEDDYINAVIDKMRSGLY